MDISAALGVLSELTFVHSQGTNCFTTIPGTRLPHQIDDLVRGLNLGGSQARGVFLRKLIGHQSIPPHVDRHGWLLAGDVRRFHVPLISHHDIIMRWPDDGVEVHLDTGYLWEVRFDRMHEVRNDTDHERIHIQIDQQGAVI